MQLTSKGKSQAMVVEFRPHNILTDKFVYTLKFMGESKSMRLMNRKEMIETVAARLDIGYEVTDFLTEPQQYFPACCWFRISHIQTSAFPTMPNFTGVFLTVENHGCVYTICTEGELFSAPMMSNGSVNFNEFDIVDFYENDEDQEELKEIQSALIDMMMRAGLYFRQSSIAA